MVSLTYLERFDIKDEKEGLTEPSGLVLTRGRRGLWTISDDTDKVFRIGLDGKLKPKKSFKVPKKGLEGITLEPKGRFLFTVREGANQIFKLNIAKRTVAKKRRLEKMAGYDKICHFFADDKDENKGLEGITWNVDTHTLFTLKEGDPGLLIEVLPDLSAIRGHVELGPHNGFRDPGSKGDKIDYSGICYDPTRAAFWIVSDKAKRVFLYDAAANRVVQSAALSYRKNGEVKEVEKAEGVAYDPRSGRLYVVSDEEVRLYVYDVRS